VRTIWESVPSDVVSVLRANIGAWDAPYRLFIIKGNNCIVPKDNLGTNAVFDGEQCLP